jgi:hypothetical protein
MDEHPANASTRVSARTVRKAQDDSRVSARLNLNRKLGLRIGAPYLFPRQRTCHWV